jgi:hypothetical protein
LTPNTFRRRARVRRVLMVGRTRHEGGDGRGKGFAGHHRQRRCRRAVGGVGPSRSAGNPWACSDLCSCFSSNFSALQQNSLRNGAPRPASASSTCWACSPNSRRTCGASASSRASPRPRPRAFTRGRPASIDAAQLRAMKAQGHSRSVARRSIGCWRLAFHHRARQRPTNGCWPVFRPGG